MPSSRAVILPYKMGSRSGKALAEGLSQRLGLRVRRVRADGRYRPKSRSLIINYGNSQAPHWLTPVNNVLNSPAACAAASNKLRAFQLFQQHNVRTPEWTQDRNTAQSWMNDGSTVVCRTLLNSHSGRGIVLAEQASGRALSNAPLYTKYKKKRKEFRVHVFNGEIIDVAEKRKIRRDNRPDNFDGYIRNHANGWIFARDNLVHPGGLDSLAISACRALSLNFGAVDIIWNEKENLCYVLEVNTAPGLEGTTLTNYINAILNWIRRQA